MRNMMVIPPTHRVEQGKSVALATYMSGSTIVGKKKTDLRHRPKGGRVR